jgi:hypothetical protein
MRFTTVVLIWLNLMCDSKSQALSGPLKIVEFIYLLTYGSLNNAVSSSDYISVRSKGDCMKWKGRRSWPNLRYNPNICLVVLRKAMINLSEQTYSELRFEPGFPEQELEVLVS